MLQVGKLSTSCLTTYNVDGRVQKITGFVLHILRLQHVHTHSRTEFAELTMCV